MKKGNIVKLNREIDMRDTGGPRILKGTKGTVLKVTKRQAASGALAWVELEGIGKRHVRVSDLDRVSFILTGDIIHSGRVRVVADSQEEALKKAERGEFEVYEEHQKNLAFSFDGSPEDHIEEE